MPIATPEIYSEMIEIGYQETKRQLAEWDRVTR